MKYPINKEFLPFSHFVPPIQNAKIAGWMGSFMRAPRWLFRDHRIIVKKEDIKSYDGAEIELLVVSPSKNQERLPCLVYYRPTNSCHEKTLDKHKCKARLSQSR